MTMMRGLWLYLAATTSSLVVHCSNIEVSLVSTAMYRRLISFKILMSITNDLFSFANQLFDHAKGCYKLSLTYYVQYFVFLRSYICRGVGAYAHHVRPRLQMQRNSVSCVRESLFKFQQSGRCSGTSSEIYCHTLQGG